jgi:pyridoxine 5-phosphate synthase
LGLGVNAGHDLNLDNLARFCTIPDILEVSIGHALTAEALEMGFAQTVTEYIKILDPTQHC